MTTQEINGYDDISTHGECWNCGMPIYDDINICSSCGEHCEEEETCPDCEGSGEVEVGLKESFASQRIDQRFTKQRCDRCNGEGRIET